MTQQYIAGELSALIGDLCPRRCSALARAADDLRHRVECAPASCLAPLVGEALELADAVCWAVLDDGDGTAFSREATEAAALAEFASCAGLLP